MNNFKRINNLAGWAVFAVAAVTYLLTIEPTTSFWDCGEFIASSYKLEVGHPPGNPVFQLLGRFFSMLAPTEYVAAMVNAMSALCSAFTILFLFWTITHLARRIMERSKGALSQGNIIAIIGAGAVGALAYTFSDTFWFSAVEAEVYAMSSLFTAMSFWAILKWEEEADRKYANRWIILLAYLMGLTIGVHLLNLLVIPAIALVYYFKKYTVTLKGIVLTLLVSVVLLLVTMFLIPTLPLLAGRVDYVFVNWFGAPFDVGAVVFLFLLFVLLGWAIYATARSKRIFWNTLVLCITVFLIGFSSFAVVVIRSDANTPTNENQPDNPFSLLYYLNREQYGSNPLISGHTFATPLKSYKPNYKYAKSDGKYVEVEGSIPVCEFYEEYTMLFPRMHSHQPEHIRHYEQYATGPVIMRGERNADGSIIPGRQRQQVTFRGKVVPGTGDIVSGPDGRPRSIVPGTEDRLPSFRENLTYFFSYQLGWMYWRYFMWNFAGRQNDIQGHGDSYHGNWESGIPFIDKARLGNTDELPDYLANHKARNHYYMLPLILGLVGLFYQLAKDKRNFSVVAILFVLTGIAIVVYLNQTPFQPRERDYAYAGSFYAFTIWIGLGVLAVYELFRKGISAPAAAGLAGALCLAVPLQMGAVNWDDHDRSNRYVARDMAYNYFMSCDENAIIFTVGDNDTFPLWYVQEVEGVRTDVRVVNTSLLSADWYIEQMTKRQYESAPVPFKVKRENYLANKNDFLRINEQYTAPIAIAEVTKDGNVYAPPRNLIIPVNKENVLKNGLVKPEDADKIPESITITIPRSEGQQAKNTISKVELMVLDLLANNNWERPIYFVSPESDVVNLGLQDYLQYEGFTYKLTPIKNPSRDPQGLIDKDKMYERLTNVYRWGNMNDPGIWVDYTMNLTLTRVLNIRQMHSRTAEALRAAGDSAKAVEILDLALERMPDAMYPYNVSVSSNDQVMLNFVNQYYYLGEADKANAVAGRILEEADQNLAFYIGTKDGGDYEIDNTLQSMEYLSMIAYANRNMELGAEARDKWRTHLQRIRYTRPSLYTYLKSRHGFEDTDVE